MDAVQREGFALVISGPSGVGKSTVVQRVLAADAHLRFSVSCTTRPPRAGEVDGRDYHFVKRDDFQARLGRGEFLEHAEVHGNFYGTPVSELQTHLPAGRDLLLDIDVQGARQLQQSPAAAAWRQSIVFVFIGPPSREVLEQRLRGRATEEEAVIRRRLAASEAELRHWHEYDYLVVNDTVAQAAADLQAIVRAERRQVQRLTAIDPFKPAN